MSYQKERCLRLPTIFEIFSPRSLFGVKRGERRLVVDADKVRPHTAKVTRTFCDDNFLRIARDLHPLYSPDWASSGVFLFGCLRNRRQSKDSNSGLQMNFFRESEKFWKNSTLTFCKRFSGSDWINRLDLCIAALQQMESTWNEVDNGPLSYSWQGSDLEMLIPSWDT
jgi:hypothetical protein